MGPAELIQAAADGGDPVLLSIVLAVLAGGGVSALLGYRRVRSGAQLDVLSAAKVIYEEQRQELAEVRAQNRELRIQRDAALEGQATVRREMEDCRNRVDELEVRVEAREETIAGLQQRLAAITEGH